MSALIAFFAAVEEEVGRARAKFPLPEALMTALTEEVGELAKAMMEEPSDRVIAEAVQVACVAARIALEGDPTLNGYRFRTKAGPHPEQPGKVISEQKLVAYIAHPLAGDRDANRAAASKWVAWAGEIGLAPVADWITLSGEWDEETGRELGLKIDCALVERCDILLLVGPRISSGMAIEKAHAEKCGIKVIDLTGLDFELAEKQLARELRWAGLS